MEIFARSSHSHFHYAYYFVEQVAYFALCGYGIFTGTQLWKIRPGAIQQAKQFLLILLVFTFLDYTTVIIRILLMTPESIRASVLSRFLYGQRAKVLLQTTIYTAIWYAYLLKSKRVRATFSLNSQLETSAATASTLD
jgi:hypothetical protein